ncbi:hypothetical protein PG993_000281 [Apiospora rasikravindrae]|uniref:Uncharacterized protein n=1 Tax=Apiospora rasikravindrae TaxID=990691 RepID=A0ABR1UAW1_9PEZI
MAPVANDHYCPGNLLSGEACRLQSEGSPAEQAHYRNHAEKLDNDLEEIKKNVEKHIEEHAMKYVEKRMDYVEKRMDYVEKRMENAIDLIVQQEYEMFFREVFMELGAEIGKKSAKAIGEALARNFDEDDGGDDDEGNSQDGVVGIGKK